MNLIPNKHRAVSFSFPIVRQLKCHTCKARTATIICTNCK